MRTLIAGLVLMALTLATLVAAPLFPHWASASKNTIDGRKVFVTRPDMNVRFQLRHELRSEKF